MCLWVNLRHDSRRDKSGDQFRVILWSSNLKNKGKIRRVGPAKGGKCLVSSKRKPFKSSSTNLNGLIILLAWIVFVLSGTRHYTCVCVFARHTLSGISSWFAKVKIERKFQQYNMSLIECTFVDAKLAPSIDVNMFNICIEILCHIMQSALVCAEYYTEKAQTNYAKSWFEGRRSSRSACSARNLNARMYQ